MTDPDQNQRLDDLIVSWEGQQDAYVRHRAQRFGIILDAIGYAGREPATILDLAGGLGSFSRRLLERFPGAKVITLDFDPSLLALARHNLQGHSARSHIVEADLLPEGGLFFNADHYSSPLPGALFAEAARADDAAQQAAGFAGGVPDWAGWWDKARAVPDLADAVAERDRRFAAHSDGRNVTTTFHAEALRLAGFAEAGTIWQYFDDYVVYGRR